MIIRSILSTDIAECARIMAENPLWQRYGITLESAERRLSSGLAQNATILIAESENRISGFLWYSTKGAFNRSGYIMLIGVDPHLQGGGIGKSLMNAAEAIMFENSSDVFLLVSDFNEAAQRFYLRQGYTQVGKLDNYVLQGVAELIFRKQKSGKA